MTTVQNNDIQSINAALLRAVKNSENVNVNNIQNVTQVNKTTEVVKLSDGTSLDIVSLRRSITALTSANEALLNKLNKQDSELKILKDQIQNIGFTTDNQGKTLVFSNYLGIDEESEVPVIIAQYSSNGLAWHDEFISGKDIYIRFSYDAGDSWTDPIKIVGEDGSAYAYYGLVSSSIDMPADLEGNFFLCGENYTGPAEFLVNGLQLLVNDKVLVVNKTYLKGFIYMYNGTSWEAVTDKNNYRYVIAMNDLISIGEPVSPGLLQQFQSSIAVYTPRYLGGFAVAPVTHNNGDTFCFIGTTTDQFTKGMCYKWSDSSGWSLLSQTAPENAEVYMKALNDILANTSDTGTFAAIFAQHITANSAFIKNLASQIITLQSNGIIQSQEYTQHTTGLQIKADGTADFSGDTYIGGNTTINGTTDIGGTVNIGGNTTINGTTDIGGTVNIGGDATISGNIISQDFNAANHKGFKLPSKEDRTGISAYLKAIKTMQILPWDNEIYIEKAKFLNCYRIGLSGTLLYLNKVNDIATVFNSLKSKLQIVPGPNSLIQSFGLYDCLGVIKLITAYYPETKIIEFDPLYASFSINDTETEITMNIYLADASLHSLLITNSSIKYDDITALRLDSFSLRVL